MPSARIKTVAVEDANSLAEDLRTRGFVVQIVSPDQTPTDPVDLEVTLEECAPETALHRADDVPDADDVCVFVAPGALTDGPRPIRVISLIPETPASVVSMPAPAAPVHAAREEALEEPAALEEPGKLVASQLEPAIVEAKPAPSSHPPKPEVPRVAEVPIVSPEVWNVSPVATTAIRKPKTFPLVAVGKRVSVWGKGVARNQNLLMKTATVVATGAVTALSVLVLGATLHRLTPLPAAMQSAGETLVLPATADAASPTVAAPQNATQAAAPEPQDAKRSMAVPLQPKPPAQPKARHRRNREEDIVAKDFVIRYNRRPTPKRTQAKKVSGVKHYSDRN